MLLNSRRRLPLRQNRSFWTRSLSGRWMEFGIFSVTSGGRAFAFHHLLSLLLHPGAISLLSGRAIPVPAPLAVPSRSFAR